jgi:hypothetical protein
MFKNSILKKMFAYSGSALLAATALATPADALEPGQCLSMAEMNATMRAEGQRTLILGNRSALNNPTGLIRDASVTLYANAVTSNTDGSLGYQLEGDRPKEEPSTRMCVRAKLTNVRVYDAGQSNVPQSALLGGTFNEAVQRLASRGINTMLVADTFQGADTNRRGNPLVVLADLRASSGQMATMTSTGPQRLALLTELGYTEEGRRRIGKTQARPER